MKDLRVDCVLVAVNSVLAVFPLEELFDIGTSGSAMAWACQSPGTINRDYGYFSVH